MTNKAWSALAALGLFGSVVMGGCVVGSSDDDTGGTGGVTGGGTGGTGNSGGSGGSGGTTGGTGGVAGGGGTGGSVVSCDPTGSTPGACTADPGNTCQECIEQNCCTEYSACIGTNPDDSCGWGGPAGEGEMVCIQNCLFDLQAEGGVADDAAISACAGSCTTPSCATISPQTNDMITCLKELCFDTCLQQ